MRFNQHDKSQSLESSLPVIFETRRQTEPVISTGIPEILKF
jgi:hypothetical protein